jgi:zinc transport system substrate-binding protein
MMEPSAFIKEPSALMKTLPAWMICCVFLACSEEATDPDAAGGTDPGALIVHATSYPLAYFAERIGASAVNVIFPVPEGIDPAHWMPDRETIARAQQADLLLRTGAGDPPWLDLASLHRDRVVDTTARVRHRLLEQETVRHQHGPEGPHSHGEWSGTTWLDPVLATAQAEAVAEAMAARRPGEAERFRENFAALARELEQIDESQAKAAGQIGDAPLLYSHPVYAYLQARYALNGRSVVWEPDQLPSEAQWPALTQLIEEHPAHTMFWEAEPLPEVAQRLAALGIESRVYSPCANRPDAGDWLTVMRENARMLKTLVAPSQGVAAEPPVPSRH